MNLLKTSLILRRGEKKSKVIIIMKKNNRVRYTSENNNGEYDKVLNDVLNNPSRQKGVYEMVLDFDVFNTIVKLSKN